MITHDVVLRWSSGNFESLASLSLVVLANKVELDWFPKRFRVE